jgi:hypothetical protein
VASGDAAGFARIIVQLAEDPAAGGRMGARARALIDLRFSRRLAFARWSEALDSLPTDDARL